VSAVSRPSAAAVPPRFASSRSADAAFAALLLLGAVIVVVETRGMSFFADDWDFVVQRRGLSAHTLLEPHGPHLSLVPILVWKVLLAVFGGGSYVPFRLLAAFDIVAVGLALGIACRDRWGRWWGLAPVLLLVTLGPGALSLLWPFQVGYALALAFGLTSLVALDRGGRWADVVACASLILSLGSASQGIGFLVGAAFMLVLGGRWRRRSWVVAIPAVLYVLWYAGYGHQHSETHLGLWGGSLSYAMQSLSATAGPLLGLSSVSPQTGVLDLTFGVPIAVALIAALAAGAWRGWRPRPIFWGAAATLVVVWFAASLSNFGAYSRPANDPRYLSSNATLVLLCLCAAVPRPRLARTGVVVACLVLAVIALTNAKQYGVQHHDFVASSSQQRAELGALMIMRGTVAPTYNPGVVDPNLVDNSAGAFFSAADAFGLQEDTPAQIRAQPESVRVSVDDVLVPNELSVAPGAAPRGPRRALEIRSGAAQGDRDCARVGATPLVLASPAGRLAVRTGDDASTITAARFASVVGHLVGSIPAHSTALIAIRADLAAQIPWRLSMTGTGARVCGIG
jgi:hypothetical protein